MPTDSDCMKQAISLARNGLGQAAPNPAVGCVLVSGGQVIGRGFTQKGGRPHAETMALAEAGAAARGSVAYVSLEPCAHHGATPPCADALAAAGVARVVSALEDPDPRVSGRGHQRLRDAGVAVEVGIEAELAQAVNIGFFTKLATGRPFVQLKLAVSYDWKIASRAGLTTAITGAESQEAVHRMRAQTDAVLVGKGTWMTDDPQLTCRLPGLEGRSPIRIVLDRMAELPATSKLVQSAREVPVWAVVGEAAPDDRKQRLAVAGVRLVEGREDEGRFDLSYLLTLLGNEGLTRLFAEGGGKVAETLVRAGLADELILFHSKTALGPAGVPAFGALLPAYVLSGFKLASDTQLGADRRITYRRAKK